MDVHEEEMQVRFAVANAWNNAYSAAIRNGDPIAVAKRCADQAAENVSDILRGNKAS